MDRLAASIALVSAAGVVVTTGFARWIALAGLITVVPELLRPLLKHPGWRRRADRVPIALLSIACITLLSELVVGHPPASRDHALHLFEMHVLVDEFLPQGRLSGWTDSINNGYAFGEAYPWFGHLWSAAAHLLSGGLVSQRTSYAWGLLAVWVLGALGVWLVAAEVAQEVDDTGGRKTARWAGCIGALVWLLDPGGSREGGWNYLMFHGVWPQLLSSTLWVLGLPLAWRAFKRPSPRRLGLAALVLGLSVLAHPFGALTLACSAAVWLVVLTLLPRARELPSGRFAWWLLIHAAAGLVAMTWLASFLAGSDSLGRSPVPWDPLATIVSELVRGTLFEGLGAWNGPLALIGCGLAMWRGGAVAWLVLGLVLGMLVLASQEAITVLQLDLLVAGFKNLQFPRYSIAIKPLFFAMSGVGAAVVARAVAARAGKAIERSRPERFMVAMVLAPFVLALATDAHVVQRPVGVIDSLQASGVEEDEAALRDALYAEKEWLGPVPLSVAFFRKGMGGAMYPAMSVAEVGGALVLDGHVATLNTKHRIGKRTAAALVGLGVTHVVHDNELLPTDVEIAPLLDKVGTFGTYTLARVVVQEAPRGSDWVEASGRGEFEVVTADSGSWDIDVEDAEELELRLPFAPHPKWHATMDGEDLEVAAKKRWQAAAYGLAVQVPRAGRVELRYLDTPREVQARWLGAVTIVVCLVALAFGAPLGGEPVPMSPQRARIVAAVVASVAFIGIVLVRKQQHDQLGATWAVLSDEVTRWKDAELELIEDASLAGTVEIARDPDRICQAVLGKDAMVGCNEADHAPHLSFLYGAPYIYRCMEFSIAPNGTATVDVPSANDHEHIAALIYRVDRRGSGKKLLYRHGRPPGGKELRFKPTRNSTRAVGTKVAKLKGAPFLELRNDSDRPETVCIATAILRKAD